MTRFEKIELVANNSNNVELLRDLLIEIITSNDVNLDGVFVALGSEIDKEVERDLSA